MAPAERIRRVPLRRDGRAAAALQYAAPVRRLARGEAALAGQVRLAAVHRQLHAPVHRLAAGRAHGLPRQRQRLHRVSVPQPHLLRALLQAAEPALSARGHARPAERLPPGRLRPAGRARAGRAGRLSRHRGAGFQPAHRRRPAERRVVRARAAGVHRPRPARRRSALQDLRDLRQAVRALLLADLCLPSGRRLHQHLRQRHAGHDPRRLLADHLRADRPVLPQARRLGRWQTRHPGVRPAPRAHPRDRAQARGLLHARRAAAHVHELDHVLHQRLQRVADEEQRRRVDVVRHLPRVPAVPALLLLLVRKRAQTQEQRDKRLGVQQRLDCAAAGGPKGFVLRHALVPEGDEHLLPRILHAHYRDFRLGIENLIRGLQSVEDSRIVRHRTSSSPSTIPFQ